MAHRPQSLYDRAHAAIDRNEALLAAIGIGLGDLLYCALVATMAAAAVAVALRLLGLIGGAA